MTAKAIIKNSTALKVGTSVAKREKLLRKYREEIDDVKYQKLEEKHQPDKKNCTENKFN